MFLSVYMSCLLNATLKHHIETYRDSDTEFVKKFLSSVYIYYVSVGAESEESALKGSPS